MVTMENDTRTCTQCGDCVQRRQPDPCLGWIPGAWFACCGHGAPDGDTYCYGPTHAEAEWLPEFRARATAAINPGTYLVVFTWTRDSKGDGTAVHLYPVGQATARIARVRSDVGDFAFEWWEVPES